MAGTFLPCTHTLALAAWIALVLFPGRKLVSGVLCAPHRPIVKHLTHHPRLDGYPRQVGATPNVRSLTRQHIRETPEKSADLCPFPFPFQIWFDGDAVQARSASRRKRGGS